mgnify:FL=1
MATTASPALRPLSVAIAACLVAGYAAMFIVWDIVAPFERPYAEGPVSVVLGVRVFGLSAQLMHALQLMVALSMAFRLWKMQRLGWQLVLFTVGYMVVSYTIWALAYHGSDGLNGSDQFDPIGGFGLFYAVILVILLVLTYPHRKKFLRSQDSEKSVRGERRKNV